MMNERGSSAERRRVPVESLRKGLDLLDLLSSPGGAEGVSLAALAERLSLKRSTAHNLLKTLCICGYAENTGEGRYRPGWKARQLGRLAMLGRGAGQAVVTALAAVAGALGEAAVLAVLVDGRRRVLTRADGTHAIRVDADVVDPACGVIWKTVTGRVLAAFCEPLERELAVPVWSDGGCLLAALGTFLPEFRCDAGRRLALLAGLQLGAARVAAALAGGACTADLETAPRGQA